MLKSFRYLLFPFSLIYGGVVWLRNYLFDKQVLKSESFNFPIVCVGNLAVGGTGKTPMTELLVRMLKDDMAVATLSRGYKRKTRGYALAGENTTALEIGDEPMQFHKKFPDIAVAVGEARLEAIPQLLHDRPGTEVIILDDAFQHRQVTAGLNIVLTEFKNLYTRDLMLPAGDLRDVKQSIKRADLIVVTKCPAALTEVERQKLIAEINPAATQTVFFTKIDYGNPYHLFNKETVQLKDYAELLLVCGIANPRPLKDYLVEKVPGYDMLKYNDHHIFDSEDLKEIKKQFDKIPAQQKIILTTEKDGVRLQKFDSELKDLPVYVLPISHSFLFDEAAEFESRVRGFIKEFGKDSGNKQ
jgi:tetraacyldisaccharide 4'-kinase